MPLGFKVIQGFDISAPEPADKRNQVANSAARLAIKFPYKSLLVYQIDTGEYWNYIGDDTQQPPSNVAGDWERFPIIYTAAGAPSNTKGVNGDYAIDESGAGFYKKASGVWTSLFDFAGSQIYTGASATGGVNGDIFIQSDGGVYRKVGGTWTLQFNIKGANGQSDKYATISTTSINLSSASDPLSVTIGTGLSYTVGQSVIVASRANNNNSVTGDVVSYNTLTGILVIDDIVISGTGTHTDWDVNLSGAPGVQGKAFIHTEANITLTQAKITAVQAGGYSTQNPYSASVLNDARSGGELAATPNIGGSMAGNSIAWDGIRWWNNGTWRGPQGVAGINGSNGAQGVQGSQGVQGNPGPGYNGISYAGTDGFGGNIYNLTPVNGAAAVQIVAPKGNQGGQGVQGPVGPQGIQGPPGANGQNSVIRFYNSSSLSGGQIPAESFSVPTFVEINVVGNSSPILLPIQNGWNAYYRVVISHTSAFTVNATGSNQILDTDGILKSSISVNSPPIGSVSFTVIEYNSSSSGWAVSSKSPFDKPSGNYLSASENATTEAGIGSGYTFGPYTYYPVVGEGNKKVIIFSCYLRAESSGGDVTLTMQRNMDGGAFSNIVSKTVRIKTGNGNPGVYYPVLIHVIDVPAPAGSYGYRVTINGTGIVRGSNGGDWTIFPVN